MLYYLGHIQSCTTEKNVRYQVDRLEFEVLSSIAEKQDLSLRSEVFSFSKEDLDAARARVLENGWLDEEGITEIGFATLEPYRVKRVTFLAAGFDSRMIPITINTIMPMVRVHGKRIFETLIDVVLEAGIEKSTLFAVSSGSSLSCFRRSIR